ncbi:DUF1156 domain-containing protein [Herpetosiphon sp. NSE202]|uniref:DUF1156 domain-containing protein n=1 Tax=Herpetosiphon sp. NSE202 TaxID=3351349 RepID=UPI0036393300
MTTRKKLIEVALPLDAINAAAAREKSIRHGHPSTLHLWWARRPLAACRAVLFASLVDDPSSLPEQFPTEEQQHAERLRLFGIIERLVLWENSTNPKVLAEAHAEILRSTNGNPPPVLDPFAGGGSIPLEAQRLGLEAHASDLNPVAVLINKALIEIPPMFANQPPIHPSDGKQMAVKEWRGAAGLAEDVRYYGEWMRQQAFERIGHLYPKVTLPKEHGGGEATVIAWLWARTVKCPNPVCGAMMPLVRAFELSTKKGKEVWLKPVIDHVAKTVKFDITTNKKEVPASPKVGRGAQFRCLVCQQIAEGLHIKQEGVAGRMQAQLMAIVAESKQGRIYLPANESHETIAASAMPTWKPETPISDDRRSLFTPLYGLTTFGDLFTDRQLLTLTTFADLVADVHKKALSDCTESDLADPNLYADSISLYLGFAVDRSADRGSTICSWDVGYTKIRNTFARQAIPMTWDYAEANPFSDSTGNFLSCVDWIYKVINNLIFTLKNKVTHENAMDSHLTSVKTLVSTDPPYYDNIGYADLSDFFYIWLKRSLASIYPDLFSTLQTPKAPELVALPHRFGGSKQQAKEFFEQGFRQVFERLNHIQHPDFPLTVYYAFKQAETDDDDGDLTTASTGWETMLEGMISSGWTINGTWPMRSELSNRMVASGTNALASSIVLVCRPRAADAQRVTRNAFLAALRRELPQALRDLQQGNIAPVDLAQAAIGPGMAVFSRYSAVLEPDGQPMRVRTALQLINKELDEVLAEQDNEYDAETRWAVAWFDQFGLTANSYGIAETLSKAKNTAIEGLVEAGILEAKAGKVRLLSRDEYPTDWHPGTDRRLTVWEITQHLCRAVMQGEEKAAALLAELPSDLAEIARDLAYRLYNTSDRKGLTQEGFAYNTLVIAWPELRKLAANQQGQASQTSLF